MVTCLKELPVSVQHDPVSEDHKETENDSAGRGELDKAMIMWLFSKASTHVGGFVLLSSPHIGDMHYCFHHKHTSV